MSLTHIDVQLHQLDRQDIQGKELSMRYVDA